MVNPRNRIVERAKTYTSKIQSKSFFELPTDTQNALKDVIEQAYVDGAIEMMENPTGGGLLHVCNKSSARGRRDAIDDVIAFLRENIDDFINKDVCEILIDKIKKYKEQK